MLPRPTDTAAQLPPGSPPRPFRTLPWSILLAAAVIAGTAGLYLRGQLVSRRSAVGQKLLAIADLKARQIERWREDLERHAASVARRADLAELAQRRLEEQELVASAGPIPSATVEIRAVRRGHPGAHLVGATAGDALSRIVPLPLAWEDSSSPVALAALGHTGLVQAVEADGRGVMAALRPIVDTDWALVASVDLAEVDEPTWSVAGQVAATATSLLVAVAAGLTLAARRRASELREREAAVQLSRAERMASLGTLAAGMAHELNNPIASVLANARFALRELRARPAAELREAVEALEDAVESTERAAAVVRGLDVFAAAGSDADRIAELRREASAAATLPANGRPRLRSVKVRRTA